MALKKIFVKKHVTTKELRDLIRKERDERVLQRLIFINILYMKDDVEYASKSVGVSKVVGYEWLKAWNDKGYDGLIPDFGGGRPPKLNDEEKKKLKEVLKSKAHWLTNEVVALIKREFNASYSSRQVIRILRSFKMHYSKPYPKDYRRPDNAKEMLKERLDGAVEKAGNGFILGFVDEASPQTTDNRQRFWSFGKSKIIKNTTKLKANTFGFYTPNGKNVVDFKENSKSPSFCEFLREIKRKNSKKMIIAIVDNARSHIAKKSREYAESLGIILVFLPTYSPDLNPIEQIWRCIRRKLSQIFIKSQWTFIETIKATFYLLAKSKSFMFGWLVEFMPELLKKI